LIAGSRSAAIADVMATTTSNSTIDIHTVGSDPLSFASCFGRAEGAVSQRLRFGFGFGGVSVKPDPAAVFSIV
jgi:hypothetical protein